MITITQLDEALETAAADHELWPDALAGIVRQFGEESLEASVPNTGSPGGMDFSSDFILGACRDLDTSNEHASKAARRLEFCRLRAQMFGTKALDREQADATNYMVLLGVRVAVSKANKRASKIRYVDIDDVIQSAIVRAYDAVKKYDWRSAPWSVYVAHWLDFGAREAAYDSRVVKIPVTVQKDAGKLRKAAAKAGVSPDGLDPEEASRLADLTPTKAALALHAMRHGQLSCDVPVDSSDGTVSLGETLEDPSGGDPYSVTMEAVSANQLAAMALSKLTPRNAEIVSKYFGVCGYDRMSQPALAAEYGVSHQRIAQIVKSSLPKMARLDISSNSIPYLADSVYA